MYQKLTSEGVRVPNGCAITSDAIILSHIFDNEDIILDISRISFLLNFCRKKWLNEIFGCIIYLFLTQFHQIRIYKT